MRPTALAMEPMASAPTPGIRLSPPNRLGWFGGLRRSRRIESPYLLGDFRWADIPIPIPTVHRDARWWPSKLLGCAGRPDRPSLRAASGHRGARRRRILPTLSSASAPRACASTVRHDTESRWDLLRIGDSLLHDVHGFSQQGHL